MCLHTHTQLSLGVYVYIYIYISSPFANIRKRQESLQTIADYYVNVETKHVICCKLSGVSFQR